MKRLSFIAGIVTIWLFWSVPSGLAFQCTVCHSRNPSMIAMHKAVQARGIGCFDCHSPGERLMGKSAPKDKDSLLKRRSTESPCIGCHAD